MKRFLVVLALLSLPGIAWGAGFAKQTLFLSQSSVTEGDTVLIHATVSNDTEEAFTGTMQFKDAASIVGTTPVSLGAGAAATVSVSWKPSSGSHTITAELRDSKGATLGQESETFTVDAKTKPSNSIQFDPEPAATSSVTSSENIQQAIANISPTVASTSEPIFSTIDSARTSAANALDKGVDWSKKQLAKSAASSSAFDKTPTTTTNKLTGTLWTILATVLLYLFSILRYVIGSAGVCYPIFAILFLFVLWKLWRRYRRRR